jgi:hypothetical protein
MTATFPSAAGLLAFTECSLNSLSKQGISANKRRSSREVTLVYTSVAGSQRGTEFSKNTGRNTGKMHLGCPFVCCVVLVGGGLSPDQMVATP